MLFNADVWNKIVFKNNEPSGSLRRSVKSVFFWQTKNYNIVFLTSIRNCNLKNENQVADSTKMLLGLRLAPRGTNYWKKWSEDYLPKRNFAEMIIR